TLCMHSTRNFLKRGLFLSPPKAAPGKKSCGRRSGLQSRTIVSKSVPPFAASFLRTVSPLRTVSSPRTVIPSEARDLGFRLVRRYKSCTQEPRSLASLVMTTEVRKVSAARERLPTFHFSIDSHPL